jgi:hypothetical protein
MAKGEGKLKLKLMQHLLSRIVTLTS